MRKRERTAWKRAKMAHRRAMKHLHRHGWVHMSDIAKAYLLAFDAGCQNRLMRAFRKAGV